jgi:hypothetical protein
MRVSPTAAEIRTVVLDMFRQVLDKAEVGTQFDQPVDDQLDERLHIQDGRLVARSYRNDGLLAMWFIEVGLLQFYDADGKMLYTMNLLLRSPSHRAAA